MVHACRWTAGAYSAWESSLETPAVANVTCWVMGREDRSGDNMVV